MMLLQNDPFRDLDSWFDRLSERRTGSSSMPMDAYRRGNDLWVHIDLPGVSPDSVDVDVERNVVTISAERSWQREEDDQIYLAERHRGRYRRQVHLGDGLDPDAIQAQYHDGVLTLRIPIAQRAQPRKIEVNMGDRAIEAATSS